MCGFQDRFSSRIRPRNLIVGVLLISMLRNLSEFGRLGIIFLLDLKIVKVDLSVLSVILFAENQVFKAFIINLPVEISSSILLQWKKIFVSSAKILKLPRGEQFGRSLMKIKNSKGPSTDP